MKFPQFVTFLIAASFLIVLLGCGGNPYEDGMNAMQKGDYNLAIKHFSEAKKATPNDKIVLEKLAQAYMLRGEELYGKTKNLNSFTGNFTKGEEFIPSDPSAEFQVEYSKLLFNLANAYQNTSPENDVQKEEFLNKTIAALESAIGYNPDNSEAEQLLNKIKSDNFSEILDKGKRLFAQAKKENNKDLYFTAEYYFKKANNFDPDNKDAASYLSKTRKQTLDVLDVGQDFALAIPDNQYDKGSYIFDIYVQNNSPDPVNIKHTNFIVIDKDGNSYPLDKDMMVKLSSKLIPEKSLTDRKINNGLLVFKTKKKIDIDYIGYKLSEDKIVKKYFP